MVDPAWKAHPPSNYPMLGPTPPQGRAGSRHLFAAHCGIFCSWGRGPSAIRRAAQGPGLGALACRHLHAALRTTSCTVLGGSALLWWCFLSSSALIFPSSALPAIYFAAEEPAWHSDGRHLNFGTNYLFGRSSCAIGY